ncbi:MAG: F0F1 ATP synthase subunit delta, partial [Bryobacterales bacterium]|nr:F0F1 ATP synthase subunit delta [Bryobacterales bacterium]
VADHRRIGHYSLIADGFRAWLDTHRNRIEVQVRSAGPIGADQKADLEGRFRELTGKDIRATYAEDPSLLGGSAVQVGSTLYDGSLRAALGSLAVSLAAGDR